MGDNKQHLGGMESSKASGHPAYLWGSKSQLHFRLFSMKSVLIASILLLKSQPAPDLTSMYGDLRGEQVLAPSNFYLERTMK